MEMKTRFIICYLPLIFCFVLFTNPAAAQINAKNINWELQQAMATKKLPGMAVVLVDGKGMIYKHSFGKADIAANKPYSLYTTQEIGSVSKNDTMCCANESYRARLLFFGNRDQSNSSVQSC